MDIRSLHIKWQSEWDGAGIFQPQAGTADEKSPAKNKFYLTAAFPYPNSPQHIGHGRTYTTTDIYARFQRMQGKNVLFPMAFHVTGTPILAMAKRIAAGDREILDVFEKIYGIPPAVFPTIATPEALVRYFSQEIETGMKEMGYSVDWRRKFYTFDHEFNRFIEWQFQKLKDAGYIVKGSHPVPWCPRDNNAVGGHDTRGDIDPQIEEVVAVLFPFADGFIATTTYRPETIYGVTNLWANPSAEYVFAETKHGKLYLSKQAADLLSHQMEVKIVSSVPASQFFGAAASHPLTGAKIPIIAASFVDTEVGTGLVMSVPAHAPYDFLALRDAGKLGEIPLVQVLKLEGYGNFPAKEICEKMQIKNQDDPRAEEATSVIYKAEAHMGIMAVGKYAGMKGIEAKVKIEEDLSGEKKAFKMFTLANAPLKCRCGATCVVKQVENQWFIDYGNENWKAKVRECFSSMRILPEKAIPEYKYTIEWLKQKACTRASGLGTKFPFDKTQMIEALSDSTIYMAYYTISHITKEMKPDELTDAFFDFVFLGISPPGNSPTENMLFARKEFLYWYPLDSRHSAGDLVHNHLTFLIFNHVAIWQSSRFWPRQIVGNGFVTMDGKKMSKSMGNIMPIRAAIARYGTDVIRFCVTSTASLEADSDFNQPAAEGIASRILWLENLLERAVREEKEADPSDHASAWFYSRLHSRIKNAPQMYGDFQLRELSQELFYNTINDLQHYMRRSPRPSLREFFEYWTLAIAPFMPHVAEEFWQRLGKKKFVHDAKFAAIAQFPTAQEGKIRPELDRVENYVISVKEDIANILKIIKREKADAISLYVADSWKLKVRETAARTRKFDVAMKELTAMPEMAEHKGAISKILMQYMKNIGAISGSTLSSEDELEALKAATSFLSSEFGCPVSVAREHDAPTEQKAKAAFALPGKPSIFIK